MRGRWALLVLSLVALGSWMAVSPVLSAAPKPPTVTVANMRIDADPAFHILPDQWTDDGAGTFVDVPYRDFRLPGGDACVQGEIYTTGLTSLVLNRRMPDGSKCADNADNPPAPRSPRKFRIRFDSADACALVTGVASASCEHLTPAGAPHVRGETVFKSKVTTTVFTFYFITQDSNGGVLNQYRLTTDTNAPIVGSTNSKTVTYTGGKTATLAQHQGNPGGYVPLVYGIPMSFRITFDRVTVP